MPASLPSRRPAWLACLSACGFALSLTAHAEPAPPAAASAIPRYTLPQLLERAGRESPALATSRAAQAGARAGLITARALPNPELSFESGRLGSRHADTLPGTSTAVSILQPIERESLRAARSGSAQARVALSLAQTGALQADLNASIRDRFFELLRLLAEQQALQEDLQLTEQILERIALRVTVGEAARFDLLRAEGEVAAVRKQVAAHRARLAQAKAALTRLVSPSLPGDFEVVTQSADTRPLTEVDYQTLRQALEDRNPELRIAREDLRIAMRQLDLEREQARAQWSLRATHERDPSVALSRVGAQVTLPLFNRREGPIAQAQADIGRAQLALEQRRHEALGEFEVAWQAYRATQSQVQAIEGGILERARQVLAIAEAAYRLGERGILEYLDAQRQFRAVRNELLGARLDWQRARTELERLAGQ